MKIVFLGLVFLLIGCEDSNNLNWNTNINKAIEIAKKENKNIAMLIYEKNCKWCIKMKKETLLNKKVQKELNKYVLLKLTRSNKKDLSQFEEFEGKIPSLFFINSKKEVLDSIEGYYQAEDFLNYLKEFERDN